MIYNYYGSRMHNTLHSNQMEKRISNFLPPMSLLSLPKELRDEVIEQLDDTDCVNLLCTCSYIRDMYQETLLRQRGLKLVWDTRMACTRETARLLNALEDTDSYGEVRKLRVMVEYKVRGIRHFPYAPLTQEMVSEELARMSSVKELKITVGSMMVLRKLLEALPRRLESLTIQLESLPFDTSIATICLEQRYLCPLRSQLHMTLSGKGLKSLRVYYSDQVPLQLLPEDDHSRKSVYGYMIDPREIDRCINQNWGHIEYMRIGTLGCILALIVNVHYKSLKRIEVRGMDAYIIFRNSEATIYMPHLRIIEVDSESTMRLLWWFGRLESNNVRSSSGPRAVLVMCNMSFRHVLPLKVKYYTYSFNERQSNTLRWEHIDPEERDDLIRNHIEGDALIPNN